MRKRVQFAIHVIEVEICQTDKSHVCQRFMENSLDNARIKSPVIRNERVSTEEFRPHHVQLVCPPSCDFKDVTHDAEGHASHPLCTCFENQSQESTHRKSP
jgi:hypothetical protein